MQTVILFLSVAGLVLTLPACLFIWLDAHDIRPVRELLTRFRRLPFWGRITLGVVAVNFILYGSTKTNQTDTVGGDGTNAPPPLLSAPLLQTSADDDLFSPEEVARGYVLAEVRSNETFSFAMPATAQDVRAWRLRGAADDWCVLSTSNHTLTLFADGRLQDTVRNPTWLRRVFHSPLGVVPEANWDLPPGSNAQSRVWFDETDARALRVTWENVLLDRRSETPVSAQAEFFENGNFVYRYDLSACGSALSSLRFQALVAEDATVADRDGDGLSTRDEIFQWRTDPGLADSDGDGLDDGTEAARFPLLDPLDPDSDGDGLVDGSDPDPTAGATAWPDEDDDGIPDAYEDHWFGGTNVTDVADGRDETGFTLADKVALGVNPTNGCPTSVDAEDGSSSGILLWKSFAASRPPEATNLLFERTFDIQTKENWQQFFLSSKPDTAGSWSLSGAVLEWEDSAGARGTLSSSPFEDSCHLPLSTNNPERLTIRLRTTATSVRSVTPVYLVAFVPKVTVSGDTRVELDDGTYAYVATNGSESEFAVSINRAKRPCKAPLAPSERQLAGLTDMVERSDGGFEYEGDDAGGVIRPSGPGIYVLPEISVSGATSARRRLLRTGGSSGDGRNRLVVLLPSVWYGTDHCSSDPYLDFLSEYYDFETHYPLDNPCLWSSWHYDFGGVWTCDCTPGASSGLKDSELVTVKTEIVGETIRAQVKVGGVVVWSGEAVHVREDCGPGGWGRSLETLDECEGACTGGCEDGDCSGLERPEAKSLKFRIPLGTPRKGQVSGFAYFDTETPIAITPGVFEYLFRRDSSVCVVTNGSARRVVCSDLRGRDLDIRSVEHGVEVRITTHETGDWEHTWRIVNVDGDVNRVRFVQTSRLGNVMGDWSFAYDYDEDEEKWSWRETDNISGLSERLTVDDRLNVDGSRTETRVWTDAEGVEQGRTVVRSEIVGECAASALCETFYYEWDGENETVRTADYWRDTGHPARNGKIRLMTASDHPWSYHEWNENGYETLRVEQRNGSDVPAEFPSATSNGLVNASGLADAFVTAYDYTPLAGDDAHPDDYGRVRCESRFVVRGGQATLIGRTWHRFTHVTVDGIPALKDEQERAGAAACAFGDADNARSFALAFDRHVAGVPLVLRGMSAGGCDEDGTLAAVTVQDADGVVTVTTTRSRQDRNLPTYEVIEMDAVYGNVLRRATCLLADDAVIEEERSVYDDQNRLRSTTFLDGTSLTNSYSCCRKLWSRDREGRMTRRSAVTGTDHLYYAEEEVWLADVSTNGYRVTQHFLDALGRETNVVTYVGTTPGEATDPSASAGRVQTESATRYPGRSYGSFWSVDARGVEMDCYFSKDQFSESRSEWSWADDADCEDRQERTVRNGMTTVRRSWNGKWSERRTWTDYDECGRRLAFEVTESSDCGVVTNSISHCDFLGRTVLCETPAGMTETQYDGPRPNVVRTIATADDVVRTTDVVYDAFGEQVGTTTDGVTNRRDVTYERVSNDWWKVTREVVSGGETNAVTESREQLTGLSAALRAHAVVVSAEGIVTESRTSFDADTGLTTRTSVSSVGGARTDVLKYGLTLSSSTDEGTSFYAYDAFGRVVCETRTAGTGSAVRPVRETDYDEFGDVVATRTYTNATDVVTESFAYDARGRRVESVNALGETVTTSYDAQGNVTETEGATYPVRYAYDTENRRTSMSTTRDGIIWDVTTWSYDPQTGRCLSKTCPGEDAGTSYTYTPDGLPQLTTQPSGQWKECVYDAQRRLVGTTSNDGAQDAAFAYDAFSRMTSASNAVASYVYDLHRGGIATNEVVAIGTNVYEIARTLDASGRLTGRNTVLSAPPRTTLTELSIAYTPANRVDTISSPLFTLAYHYTPDGCDAGQTLTVGSSTFRRVVARDAYRTALVTSVSNFVNGVACNATSYAHDALSRVTGRAHGPSCAATDEFGYNEKGEVTYASLAYSVLSPPSATGRLVSNYAYDNIGNFTSLVQGTNAFAFVTNARNQYESVGSAPLAYTPDGALEGFDGLSFAYDSAARLTSVSSNGVCLATYAYDAFGRRVRKETSEATTTFVYDGWNLVREEVAHTNGVTDVINYYWGKDLSGTLDAAGGVGGLVILTVNGVPYIPLYDANGNVIAYVDAAGNLVVSFTYDAFGNSIVHLHRSPLPCDFHFRFSTKYLDPESGLYYYGYRYYAPSLARWLTRDPIEEQGGLNLYGFCGNNGVNKYDLLGNSFWNGIIEAARNFWRTDGVAVFQSHGWCWGATFLLHSLQDHPSQWDFNESSSFVTELKTHSAYKNMIKRIINEQTAAYKSYNKKFSPINYNSGDMEVTVGNAEAYISGGICKPTRRVNLDILITDTYDFHFRWFAPISFKNAMLLIGNTLARLDQITGAIVTYPWTAKFKDKGKY